MMNWMTEKENILLKLENQKLNEDIRELNKELTKFRPFKGAYEMKEENKNLHSIIKEVREEMENAKHISVDDSKAIIKHEKRILEILDKVGDKE